MAETLSGESPESKKLSVEELQRIQEEHLAEKEAEEQARGKAGEEADERLDLLADVEKLRKEVEEKKARGELKGEISYADLEAGHKEAQERLEQMKKIIEGVPADKIAKEVSDEIARATAEVEDLKNKLDQTEAIGKLEKVNQRIAAIEANPAMMELLIAEAKTEDEIRNEVLRSALEQSGSQMSYYPRPERQQYLKELVQTFLSEEFEARQISAIKDPKERFQQMRALAQNIVRGLHVRSGMGSFEEYRGPQHKDAFTGVLLKNLVGGYGTSGGTAGFMQFAERGFDPNDRDWQNKESLGKAIGKHLKTLNFMRAYSAGIKDYHLGEQIIPCFRGWGEFDREIWGTGFRPYEGQPIISDKVSEAEKTKIQERFDKVKAKAEKIEEEYKKVAEEKKTAQTQQLEAEIQELQAALPQIQKSEAILEGRQWQESTDRLQEELAKLEERIAHLQRTLDGIKQNIEETGFLSFGRRRDLNEDRKGLESEIAQKTVERDRVKRRLTEVSEAEETKRKFGSKYEVERKISDNQFKIKQIKQGY